MTNANKQIIVVVVVILSLFGATVAVIRHNDQVSDTHAMMQTAAMKKADAAKAAAVQEAAMKRDEAAKATTAPAPASGDAMAHDGATQ
jgi:hypothetical protein